MILKTLSNYYCQQLNNIFEGLQQLRHITNLNPVSLTGLSSYEQTGPDIPTVTDNSLNVFFDCHSNHKSFLLLVEHVAVWYTNMNLILASQSNHCFCCIY